MGDFQWFDVLRMIHVCWLFGVCTREKTEKLTGREEGTVNELTCSRVNELGVGKGEG